MECPLCAQTFPAKKIESHAATCDGTVPEAKSVFSVLMSKQKQTHKNSIHTKQPVAPASNRARLRSPSSSAVEEDEVFVNAATDAATADHLSQKRPRRFDHEQATPMTQGIEQSSHDSARQAKVKTPAASAFDLLMNRQSRNKSKPVVVEEEIVTEEEDDEDEEERAAGPSAFSLMMSAAAELSRPPECLVLDFSTFTCQWFDVAPSSASNDWKATVKLGRGASQFRVSLTGRNFLSAEENPSPPQCSPVSRLTVGTLKSILQKSFRRRDPEACRRAANELVMKSWNDLVRRVPIVILEDGLLTNAFASLVWIMLAESAGLPCTSTIAAFVVDSLIEASQGTIMDPFSGEGVIVMPTRMDLAKLSSPNAAAQVFAIKARAWFGGMGGDVQMCKAYTRMWYERVAQKNDNVIVQNVLDSLSLNVSNSSSSSSSIHPSKARLFGSISSFEGFSPSLPMPPPSGVDFHCQPKLFDDILAKHNVSMSDFRSAMWQFRSGLNFRASIALGRLPNETELEEIKQRCLAVERGNALQGHNEDLMTKWKKVCSDVEKVSVEYLRQMVVSSLQ